MKSAVLFDLDNTFYPYAPAHAAGLAAVGMDEAYHAGRKTTSERLKGQAASHSRLLYFHAALEFSGKRSQPAEALRLEKKYWKAYFDVMKSGLDPMALPLLSALKKACRPIGLATDLTTAVQFEKLEFLGLEGCFDAVVTSEEAGVEKPDPRMLELLFKKLGCAKEGALLIGDDLVKDGGAAAAAGIQFIHMGHEAVDFRGLAAKLELILA